MKHFITSLAIALCSIGTAHAQSSNQGSVTVNQSAEIDALVNGKKTNTTATNTNPATKKQETPRPTLTPEAAAPAPATNAVLGDDATYNDNAPYERRTKTVRKLVRHVRKKVDGYRVQVYTGGNKRVFRQAAEEAGMRVKKEFPDLPVYVHFNSPRWQCRVGNFTSHGEAVKVLRKVRRMGYKNAIIIKMKVTALTPEILD
jgi:hypothetical protein